MVVIVIKVSFQLCWISYMNYAFSFRTCFRPNPRVDWTFLDLSFITFIYVLFGLLLGRTLCIYILLLFYFFSCDIENSNLCTPTYTPMPLFHNQNTQTTLLCLAWFFLPIKFETTAIFALVHVMYRTSVNTSIKTQPELQVPLFMVGDCLVQFNHKSCC